MSTHLDDLKLYSLTASMACLPSGLAIAPPGRGASSMSLAVKTSCPWSKASTLAAAATAARIANLMMVIEDTRGHAEHHAVEHVTSAASGSSLTKAPFLGLLERYPDAMITQTYPITFKGFLCHKVTQVFSESLGETRR